MVVLRGGGAVPFVRGTPVRAARYPNKREHQCDNNYFTEMCRGSEARSYLRRIDFMYHSTLGAIKKKQKECWGAARYPDTRDHQLENNFSTEMHSGSEAVSHIGFVYHWTPGWRVIKKNQREGVGVAMYPNKRQHHSIWILPEKETSYLRQCID